MNDSKTQEPRDPSRLYCCSCGADIGNADDPYSDPDCSACLRMEAEDRADILEALESAQSEPIDPATMRAP